MGIKDVFCQRKSKVLHVIKDDGVRAYGNTVYTEDDLGNRFIFAHLDWVSVKPGDTIEPWEAFAGIGDTGYSPNGPHLHWGMFPKGAGYMGASTAIDPSLYLKKYGYPCNTEMTNPFGSEICNPKLKGHEGIDFSGWREIKC